MNIAKCIRKLLCQCPDKLVPGSRIGRDFLSVIDAASLANQGIVPNCLGCAVEHAKRPRSGFAPMASLQRKFPQIW